MSPDYLQKFIDQIIVFLPKLALAIFIFLVALYLGHLTARLARRALIRRDVDPELALLLSRSAKWTVIVIGTFQALAQVNFNLGAFLTGLGILGFTVGFALQDITKNFVAGILLLLQQPFDIGSAVEVSGHAGTVVDIQVRSTTIRTWDGLIVIIPNADVYTSVITNYSQSVKRRVQLDVGVAYDSDLEQVTQILLETLQNIADIIQDDPAPAIYFQEFGDSAINLSAHFWCDISVCNPFVAKDQALKAVKTAFAQAKIEIPYPVRTVVMEKV